jgi:hypothetical protein
MIDFALFAAPVPIATWHRPSCPPAGRAEDQSSKSRAACLRRSAVHSSTFRGLVGWLKARDAIKRPPGAACQPPRPVGKMGGQDGRCHVAMGTGAANRANSIIKALTITKSPPVLLLQALNTAQDVL